MNKEISKKRETLDERADKLMKNDIQVKEWKLESFLPEEQKQIAEFSNQIEFLGLDSQLTLQKYGLTGLAQCSKFTDEFFKSFVNSSMEREVREELMNRLTEAKDGFEGIASQIERKKRFKSFLERVPFIKTEVEVVSKKEKTKVDSIGSILDGMVLVLDKKCQEVINVSINCDKNIEEIRKAGRTVTMYIISAEMAIDRAKTCILPKLKQEWTETGSFDKETEYNLVCGNLMILEDKVRLLKNNKSILGLQLYEVLNIRQNLNKLVSTLYQATNNTLPQLKQEIVIMMYNNVFKSTKDATDAVNEISEDIMIETAREISLGNISVAESYVKGDGIDPRKVSQAIEILRESSVKVEEILNSTVDDYEAITEENERKIAELIKFNHNSSMAIGTLREEQLTGLTSDLKL